VVLPESSAFACFTPSRPDSSPSTLAVQLFQVIPSTVKTTVLKFDSVSFSGLSWPGWFLAQPLIMITNNTINPISPKSLRFLATANHPLCQLRYIVIQAMLLTSATVISTTELVLWNRTCLTRKPMAIIFRILVRTGNILRYRYV